ncbi:MAG: glycosyl transferase family 1, partial [Candidatus Limnocylindrales bacterium]
AVVSTPYWHAKELLADGRGVLVPQGSPSAFASAINDVLDDDRTRAAIGRRAHKYSRPMVWSEVGASYRRLFASVAAGTPSASVDSSRTALNA